MKKVKRLTVELTDEREKKLARKFKGICYMKGSSLKREIMKYVKEVVRENE